MNWDRFDDVRLMALYRVVKTSARAFFRHPRNVMALREELVRRGLI